MVNITGQITPLREISELGRSRGIEVVGDGAHSFAHFPFQRDDIGCDYFGTSLHKWLFAPKGTGMLYVKREKIERLWSLMAAEKKQATDIRKFEEIGTHSAAPRLAIGEAILSTARSARSARAPACERSREDGKCACARPRACASTRRSTKRSRAQSAPSRSKASSPARCRRTSSTCTASSPRRSCMTSSRVEEIDRFAEVMETVAKRGLPA